MTSALFVFGCFLGTLGVALLAYLGADYANRKDGHRQFEYERRLQWRIDRAPEDRDYLYLRNRPLSTRLGEMAGEIGASDAERSPLIPALAVPAVSPNLVVEQGQAVSR